MLMWVSAGDIYGKINPAVLLYTELQLMACSVLLGVEGRNLKINHF